MNGIRFRITLAAVLIVGIALVLASVAMAALLQEALIGEIELRALTRAEEVAAGMQAAGGSERLAVGDTEDQFIQILDQSGAVVTSSANVAGLPAAAELSPGESARIPPPPRASGPYLAVSAPAHTNAGTFTVLVARSLDDATEPVRLVRALLSVGVPFLLLIVAATSWLLVGKALSPVEAIRGEVESISFSELHRRVPEPPGQDEIGRLAVTMNRMLSRLESAQVRQRQFVADASHELRSPVASIRQHAEVALAHPETSTLGELAQTVLNEDLRIQHIVDGLLVLARADEGTLAVADLPVDLDDLVFEEARRLRDSGVNVATVGVSAGRVRGDPAQLRSLVRNLGDNAAQHAASQVSFNLDVDGEFVRLRVDDDGPGVPPHARERVFERFVRLDEARTRDHGGAGLGLAIVSAVATAYGGSVTATDAPQGGARFEVLLPRVEV